MKPNIDIEVLAPLDRLCEIRPMTAIVTLHAFSDLELTPKLLAGLDDVFFSASNTQSFANPIAREAFRQRWLGQYLIHDPQLATVALRADQTVAGYIVGNATDPAMQPRFADIGYFQTFKHLTGRYPAHLHVNLSVDVRGCGIGRQLIDAFIADIVAVGCSGVHVVTSRDARNVAFYARQGFKDLGATGSENAAIVFLARHISTAA